MCEFKVYLRANGELKEVARGVVKAVVEDGVVTLITLFGEVKKINDAAIETVDVPNERMILTRL